MTLADLAGPATRTPATKLEKPLRAMAEATMRKHGHRPDTRWTWVIGRAALYLRCNACHRTATVVLDHSPPGAFGPALEVDCDQSLAWARKKEGK